LPANPGNFLFASQYFIGGEMPFKKFSCLFLATFFILFNETYSQSLGIIYEASSFNLQDFFYYSEYSKPSGLIKNVFINYNASLFESFLLSLKVGYGWNSYESRYESENNKEVYDQTTKGIPLEAEIQYHHYLEKDSVFEPLIGFGLGYYYYLSRDKASYSTTEHKYTSEGLGQYIMIGMNINISSCLSTSVQFKKIMINGITTKYESENYMEEKDYAQGNGLDDIGVSFGIFLRCQ
jgi:hypothetical protein